MNKYTKEIMELVKEQFTNVAGIKKFQNSTETRMYYLESYEDNLIEPMGDNAVKAYGMGSGNEISSGKINALRSSSALTYNLFGNKAAKIKNVNSNMHIGNGDYSVEFEKQFRTLKKSVSGNPANLDAFLYSEENCEAIACEMKMMEWIFNKPGKLKRKYLMPESYIDSDCADAFISVANELILYNDYNDPETSEEYPCIMTRYDAFQMFKHALACYTACMGGEKRKIKKLTLVNCVWTLPCPERLSLEHCNRYIKEECCEHDEFDRFKQLITPVKALFKKINVDFDVEFYNCRDFISLFEKNNAELDYLKRYTFN